MRDGIKKRKNFWTKRKAAWYNRGRAGSGFPKAALMVILPRIKDASTVLDVGSGPGTLAIPLARAKKCVTAVEPSPHMAGELSSEIKKLGIKNASVVNAPWKKTKLKPHDAVICANVPELLKDPVRFASQASKLARKYVFIITGADPKADKFYYRELFPLILKKIFKEKTDYLQTYSALHSIGIFANVEIIEYDFDQPFVDIDEAVEFWKEYMNIKTEKYDAALKKFLSKKLVKTKKGPIAKFHKKSAVIWWHTANLQKPR